MSAHQISSCKSGRQRQWRAKESSGFTILETLMVVALLFIMMGLAIFGWSSTWYNFKVNSALDNVTGQLRIAREMAISKRRSIEVSFTNPNQLQIIPENPDGTPLNPNPNPVVTMGGASQFLIFPGVPDTPMLFGNGAAIAFFASAGAPVPPLRFTSTGSFVDANNNLVNGTVFLGIPGKPSSARAATILGSTGRVRAYYWNGGQWYE
jgi:type II secretory pathway pseudopilin PulG